MSYHVPDQPDVPNRQKKVVKTELVEQITNQTIDDLFWNYDCYLMDIEAMKCRVNEIVDELIAINELISIDCIPEKLKQEKK